CGFGYWLPAGALLYTSQNNATDTRSHNANLIVTLRDLTIQNDSTAQWSCAAIVGPCSNWRIENCKFIGRNGLAVTASFNMVIRSCSAESNAAFPTADAGSGLASPNPNIATTPTFHWPVPAHGNWDSSGLLLPERITT